MGWHAGRAKVSLLLYRIREKAALVGIQQWLGSVRRGYR